MKAVPASATARPVLNHEPADLSEGAAWVYWGFAWWPPLYEDLEQIVNFQGVVMNVADLNRSIDFYREVLDFPLLSQQEHWLQ